MAELSTVRNNLLTRPRYTPYCGGERCYLRRPRATFNGSQFECRCGWRSSFEPEFIEQYKAAQTAMLEAHVSGVPAVDPAFRHAPNCGVRFATAGECTCGMGEGRKC